MTGHSFGKVSCDSRQSRAFDAEEWSILDALEEVTVHVEDFALCLR